MDSRSTMADKKYFQKSPGGSMLEELSEKKTGSKAEEA